jgi:hypothetical protein
MLTPSLRKCKNFPFNPIDYVQAAGIKEGKLKEQISQTKGSLKKLNFSVERVVSVDRLHSVISAWN